MTDKEKIRAEIERRISRNKRNKVFEDVPEKRHQLIIEGQLLGELKHFINSLQEEPKLSNVERIIKNWKEPVSEKKCMFTKDNYTDEDRKVLCEDCKERCTYAIADAISTNAQIKKEPVSESIDFEKELYRAFGQVKDFTLGMQIAKRFYNMGRFDAHIQDGDKIAINEDGVRTNISRLHMIAKKYGPINNDLWEAAQTYYEELQKENFEGSDVIDAYYAGAKWQKEQFEKNRLKHCNSITNEQAELEQGFIDLHLDKNNRMPTFLDAIEYGMRIQKEQMMKDATDVTVHIDAGGYPYIPQIELYDYCEDIPLAKEGDKYKVVLIKEN